MHEPSYITLSQNESLFTNPVKDPYDWHIIAL